MEKLSRWIYHKSTGLITIITLALFLVFGVLTLPGQSAAAEMYSGGMGSPDTSLFYSGNDLYNLAGVYGEGGRAAYLQARWTFDLGFPIVYTLFLLCSSSYVLNFLLLAYSRWRILNLLPLAAMGADFLENSMTSLVFLRFPAHSILGEVLAPLFTPIKWLLVGACFGILILGLFLLVLRRIQKKRV